MKTVSPPLNQFARALRCAMPRAMALVFLAATSLALAQVAGGSSSNVSSEVVTNEWSGGAVVSSGGIRLRLNNGRLQSAVATETWMDRPLPVKTYLRALTCGHGLFVAVGGSYSDVPGVIVTSQDGISWARRNPQNKVMLHGVTWGHDLFVAVGDEGVIWTSPDGARWKGQRSGTSATLAAVAFGNGVFVAGGESGFVAVSTNGVHWVPGTVGTPAYLGRIVFFDGIFVAGDRAATFVSADGLDWWPRKSETVEAPLLSSPGKVLVPGTVAAATGPITNAMPKGR